MSARESAPGKGEGRLRSEGGSAKTIRAERDKSVVNSIKVLMFSRSVQLAAVPSSSHIIIRPCMSVYIRTAVICQVSFRTGIGIVLVVFFSNLARPPTTPRPELKNDHYLVYIYEIGYDLRMYLCICARTTASLYIARGGRECVCCACMHIK